MKDFIAPFTAAGVIFGGGVFLYLTLGLAGARVESVHLIISGLMGGAAQYLFGSDIQKRATDAQPQQTITTTAGPPQTTTVTDNAKDVDPAVPFPDDRYEFR